MGGLQLDGRLALTIGVVTLGVVWGWWTVPLTEAARRGVAAMLIVAAAAAQGAEVVWLVGSTSLPLLFLGWLIGFVMHHAFRTGLRARAVS